MIKDTKELKIAVAALSIAEYDSFASSLNNIDLSFDEYALQNEDDYIISLSKIISSNEDELYFLIHRLESNRIYYIDQINRYTKDKNLGKALAMVTASLIMIADVFIEYKSKKDISSLYQFAKKV